MIAILLNTGAEEASRSAGEPSNGLLRFARKIAGPEAWNAGACALAVLLGWVAITTVGPIFLSAISAVPVNLVEALGCGFQAAVCLP